MGRCCIQLVLAKHPEGENVLRSQELACHPTDRPFIPDTFHSRSRGTAHGRLALKSAQTWAQTHEKGLTEVG